MPQTHRLIIRFLAQFVLLLFVFSSAYASDLRLPNLGNGGGGIISPAQEHELGQKWLRYYRSQVFTESDPFLQEYLENLIRKLTLTSELTDKRLDILVIDNPTLNAFAVPGGIIGIHTGLFKYAQTEQQLASVIAHELAHLSQRHYARKLAEQSENRIPNMAALLASILIAATSGGEAGMAAISATQAYAIESQLRFSRQMEQEADRVGMTNMLNAGMDPYAMSAMFEQMSKASRFQRRPPEFLLTHPLTESRINDAHLRAQQHPKKQYPLSEAFLLAKTRAVLSIEKNNSNAIKLFEGELLNNSYSSDAAQYGLALAHTRAGNTDIAKKLLNELLAKNPNHLHYVVALAEAYAEEKSFTQASKLLTQQLERNPSSHPLNIRLAEILMKAGQYDDCIKLLVKHVKRRPKDDYVWYLMAEVYGLTGDIYHVHTARAEYFLLNGLFEKSEIQLKNALKLVKDDKFLSAQLDQKLKYVKKLKKEFDKK